MLHLLLASTMLLTGAQESKVSTPNSLQEICSLPTLDCEISHQGVVVGMKGNTTGYETAIEEASKRFEAYFGRPAPKAAIILGNSVSDTQRRRIRQDHPVVLPWLTPKDKKALIERSIRQQLKQRMPNLTDAKLDAMVQQSLKASQKAKGVKEGADELHQGVVAHELGHLYFIETYWPNNLMDIGSPSAGHMAKEYGGPAADWLDEIAAVLLETPFLKAQRRQGLSEIVREARLDDLWSLEEFFFMTHPAFEQAKKVIKARQNTAEGRSKGGVVILSKEDVQSKGGRSPLNFYLQAQGFADYLIEKTGDKKVFASIAESLSKGGSFISWLETKGQVLGIPLTVAKLDIDFKQWITQTYKRKDR
ncbi:hypothetical protein QGN29_10080 [Temperatibacter marinus]|uniref:Uncharacterized protein n=1 Tax=Temperatibacter marinus TaxID=1456591 RepID=A0AA52H8J4_9PROT|nr:hypothetical protein [Temperatibacter marinus]WND01899.1 hypothetical protein QGN29_10080 [Temperatibacter marinus]